MNFSVGSLQGHWVEFEFVSLEKVKTDDVNRRPERCASSQYVPAKKATYFHVDASSMTYPVVAEIGSPPVVERNHQAYG